MIGPFCFVLAVLASPFRSKLRLEAENAVASTSVECLEAQAPVGADLAIGIEDAGAVAHQTPVRGKLTRKIYYRNCVARGQLDELLTAANEECISADHKRIDPALDKGSEGPVYFNFGAGFHNMNRPSECAPCLQQVFRFLLGGGESWGLPARRTQQPWALVPVGNLIRLASEAESRNVSIL